MALIFKKYINNEEHCWYDSSNVLYSKITDNDNNTINVKVVYKRGATYIYRDVNKEDYNNLRFSESSGKSFNEILKNYEYVRVADTDIKDLEELKKTYMDITENNMSLGQNENKFIFNEKNGTIKVLNKDGVILFEGIEGQISLMKFLTSIDYPYIYEVE